MVALCFFNLVKVTSRNLCVINVTWEVYPSCISILRTSTFRYWALLEYLINAFHNVEQCFDRALVIFPSDTHTVSIFPSKHARIIALLLHLFEFSNELYLLKLFSKVWIWVRSRRVLKFRERPDYTPSIKKLTSHIIPRGFVYQICLWGVHWNRILVEGSY